MNYRVALSTVLMVLLFLPACSLQRNWNYVPDLGPEEKLLLIPYNSNSKSVGDDQFPLYYFTANVFDKNKPTIIFCAGGPGQIVIRGSSTFTGFLEKAGYNVVYFHLRGTGFSQFPQSNSYDEYLRTNLAVEDIERIR